MIRNVLKPYFTVNLRVAQGLRRTVGKAQTLGGVGPGDEEGRRAHLVPQDTSVRLSPKCRYDGATSTSTVRDTMYDPEMTEYPFRRKTEYIKKKKNEQNFRKKDFQKLSKRLDP